MKNLILTTITLFAVSTFNSSAQGQVNEVITGAFNKKYPKAQSPEFEMEDGMWEGEFMDKGEEVSAFFSENGAWLYTKRELSSNNYPGDVVKICKENYSSFTIEEINSVESEKDGRYHLVELTSEESVLEIRVLPSGKLLIED